MARSLVSMLGLQGWNTVFKKGEKMWVRDGSLPSFAGPYNTHFINIMTTIHIKRNTRKISWGTNWRSMLAYFRKYLQIDFLTKNQKSVCCNLHKINNAEADAEYHVNHTKDNR